MQAVDRTYGRSWKQTFRLVTAALGAALALCPLGASARSLPLTLGITVGCPYGLAG